MADREAQYFSDQFQLNAVEGQQAVDEYNELLDEAAVLTTMDQQAEATLKKAHALAAASRQARDLNERQLGWLRQLGCAAWVGRRTCGGAIEGAWWAAHLDPFCWSVDRQRGFWLPSDNRDPAAMFGIETPQSNFTVGLCARHGPVLHPEGGLVLPRLRVMADADPNLIEMQERRWVAWARAHGRVVTKDGWR